VLVNNVMMITSHHCIHDHSLLGKVEGFDQITNNDHPAEYCC
jgi:hypothetical protein